MKKEFITHGDTAETFLAHLGPDKSAESASLDTLM